MAGAEAMKPIVDDDGPLAFAGICLDEVSVGCRQMAET